MLFLRWSALLRLPRCGTCKYGQRYGYRHCRAREHRDGLVELDAKALQVSAKLTHPYLSEGTCSLLCSNRSFVDVG